MKAILVREDRSLVWTDVPDPVIKPDEVLIKTAAAGINRADLMQREGVYPPPPGWPEWMGLEISGVIAAMGSEAEALSGRRTGDPVCALLGGGGYAEYCAVRYDMLLPVPAGFSMAEAASLPEIFATSYLNLVFEAQLQAGETLLVHAAASGLAGAAIPMAKAFGARVITTIRRENARGHAEALGADLVINTSECDIAGVLAKEEKAGRGVDAALDCLGGDMAGRCLPFVNYRARWIMIAALAGRTTEIDLVQLYVKNARLIGSTLRSRCPEIKARVIDSLKKEIWPLLERGEIKPYIRAILPMTRAGEGHALLRDRAGSGKVVLIPEL